MSVIIRISSPDKAKGNLIIRDRDIYGEGPVYLDETYIGTVLYVGWIGVNSNNGFYVLVWDGKKVTQKNFPITKEWSYLNTATVDATREVLEKVIRWEAEKQFKIWKISEERKAKTPQLGKKVRILNTQNRREKEGTVFLRTIVRDLYTEQIQGYYLGIRTTNDNTVWVNQEEVEVIDWEKYMPNEGVGKRRAKHFAEQRWQK